LFHIFLIRIADLEEDIKQTNPNTRTGECQTANNGIELFTSFTATVSGPEKWSAMNIKF